MLISYSGEFTFFSSLLDLKAFLDKNSNRYQILAYLDAAGQKTPHLITKISGKDKTYYLDRLVDGSLPEASTDSSIALAFYKVAKNYVPLHCIQCFSCLDVADQVPRTILDYLQNCYEHFEVPRPILSDEEEQMLKNLSTRLNLTVTQKHQLAEHACAYKVRQDNVINGLEVFLGMQPDNTRERTTYFNQIIEILSDI